MGDAERHRGWGDIGNGVSGEILSRAPHVIFKKIKIIWAKRFFVWKFRRGLMAGLSELRRELPKAVLAPCCSFATSFVGGVRHAADSIPAGLPLNGGRSGGSSCYRDPLV